MHSVGTKTRLYDILKVQNRPKKPISVPMHFSQSILETLSDFFITHTFYFLLAKRKRFNQTSILRHLKAKCEYTKHGTKCGKNTNLTLHHKNPRKGTDWTNIVIYCREHHNIVHGQISKKSQR